MIVFCLPLVMVTNKTQAADDSNCTPVGENPQPVMVKVSQHIPFLEEDATKTQDDITRLVTHPAGKTVAGVFYSEGPSISITYQSAVSTTREPRSMTCLWVTTIDADMTIKKMVIYSAKEYPPGSCRYYEIMAHEEEHFRSFSFLIQIYTDRLQEAIQELNLPSAAHPWSVPSAQEGQRQITALLTSVQQSVSDSFLLEKMRRDDEFHEQEAQKQSQCR